MNNKKLTQCSGCWNAVPKRAVACPHCGLKLGQKANPAGQQPSNTTNATVKHEFRIGPPTYNPIALVSLVSGILSLAGIFTVGIFAYLLLPVAIVAVVTGGVGIHYGNKGGGGKGMATVGLILGIFYPVVLFLYVFLWAAFWTMLFDSFNQ